MQKLHNEEILAKAELIRCLRVAELINRNIGYIGPEKRNRDFLDYFKKATLKHPQTWQSAYLHFYRSYICTLLNNLIIFTVSSME